MQNYIGSMMRLALAALVLVVAVGGAKAENLPEPVATAVAEAKASCKPEPAQIGKGFLQRRDVNGDGATDFVLSYEAVVCRDGGRINCGSAGCLTQVFVSTSSGFLKILDKNVQQVGFRKVKGRPAMLLGLHGSSCGKAGFESCGATLYWNGLRFSPAN